MAFVPTGLHGLDRAHAGLDQCLAGLHRSMREKDASAARGWACLLMQKVSEHFTDEEEAMRATGWSRLARHAESHGRILLRFERFERRLQVHDVTLDLSYLALVHLPELLRVHQIASDFGFAKFAMNLTGGSAWLGGRVTRRPEKW
jgi:hemerythrin